MKQEQSNKLLLIDGHSILNRAFFDFYVLDYVCVLFLLFLCI